MNIARSVVDSLYKVIQPAVFRLTRNDPERAHEWFVSYCRLLYASRLEELILNNTANELQPPFELANAAGFNKNASIPPTVLYYIGFDRVVIGTVTYDQWDGNPRPRIQRIPETQSMVNWMGLPGDGAATIAERLQTYNNHGVPLTINFMATPGKQGDGVLEDLEGTIKTTRNLPYIDRFELNISCQNTHGETGGMDAREEYQRQLEGMLEVTDTFLLPNQELDLKISPDSDEDGVDDILAVCQDHTVHGFTTTNTTTEHNTRYVPQSPRKGGASGNAVYEKSTRVQRWFAEKRRRRGLEWRITACGGISSVPKAQRRRELGAEGIQIFTPLIFSGPQLIRALRTIE